MITINLEDTYQPTFVSGTMQKFVFESYLRNGNIAELHVLITKHNDPNLPRVYNLAFGTLDSNGEIDDNTILGHQNNGKVFSTVLLFAITFLQTNNTKSYSIGIDGSNETRAYLYHRMFRYNYKNLSDLVVIIGVDWYVKLLRNGTDIERDPSGYPLFKPRPEPFDMLRKPTDLYRYYIFSLNQ